MQIFEQGTIDQFHKGTNQSVKNTTGGSFRKSKKTLARFTTSARRYTTCKRIRDNIEKRKRGLKKYSQ